MSDIPEPRRLAGGVFIAFGALGGALIGVIAGQPSLGLLAGLALGGATAIAMWWLRR